MHDPNGLNPAVQISNRNFESGSLAAASFRICRREGLRPVCRNSTSLCGAPTAGFRRPSGPPCGRPNLLPANLSNPGFSSDLVFPSDTKRAPLREPFLYLAEREGLCGTSLCRTPTAGSRRPSGPPCGRPKSLPAILSNRACGPGLSSSLPLNQTQKNPALAGLFCVWRRERDSNPRYAINVYSLSRGALSTSQPSLHQAYKLQCNSPIHKAIAK